MVTPARSDSGAPAAAAKVNKLRTTHGKLAAALARRNLGLFFGPQS